MRPKHIPNRDPICSGRDSLPCHTHSKNQGRNKQNSADQSLHQRAVRIDYATQKDQTEGEDEHGLYSGGNGSSILHQISSVTTNIDMSQART